MKLALQEQCQANSYTELMMFYEYMVDIARLTLEKGLYNSVVSGGYVNPSPVKALCKVMSPSPRPKIY